MIVSWKLFLNQCRRVSHVVENFFKQEKQIFCLFLVAFPPSFIFTFTFSLLSSSFLFVLSVFYFLPLITMDVQGYMPHRSEDPHQQQVLHYAQVNLTPEDTSKTHSLPPLASIPAHVSNDQDCADSVTSDGPPSCSYASSLPVKTEDNPIPAIPASVFDKRKSSPAVLGLPLGLNDEAQAQLSLHLSQQRNSIEAAMLLANFNRLPPATTTCQSNPSTTEDDEGELIKIKASFMRMKLLTIPQSFQIKTTTSLGLTTMITIQ